MDDDIIQAYLWHNIIRLGFSPSEKKDIKSWLYMYGENLKDFWEVDEYPPHPKSDGTITAKLTCAASLGISLSYCITNITRFSVTFLFSDRNNKSWVHDVDGNYFAFPEQSLLSKYGKEKTVRKKITSAHIKKVLDGLIFHPTVHQHIKTDFHSIRIGGGIHNPFLYLFHLKYQLCPDKKRRDEEKERLIRLFEPAVKNDTQITVNELMKG
ncbi:hypothetical protein ES708_11011 [subsurface metagenome]